RGGSRADVVDGERVHDVHRCGWEAEEGYSQCDRTAQRRHQVGRRGRRRGERGRGGDGDDGQRPGCTLDERAARNTGFFDSHCSPGDSWQCAGEETDAAPGSGYLSETGPEVAFRPTECRQVIEE